MTRNLTMSMQPFWLLGVGALAGLAIVTALWLIVYLIHRPTGIRIGEVLRERMVFPVLILAAGFGLFTLAMTAWDATGGRFFDLKSEALHSVTRIASVGLLEVDEEIPAGATEHPVIFRIPAGELKKIELKLRESDQEQGDRLMVSWNRPFAETQDEEESVEIRPEDSYSWSRRREPTGPLAGELAALYVANETASPITLQIQIEQQMVVPEARVIVVTAMGLVVFVLCYILLQFLFPKMAAIALTTGKEAVSQPVFYLTMIVGSFLLLLFIIIPYFTFGEDVKVYKDTGMQLIMILGIFIALWTASVSVADEIEGRTALTVLSKPVSRRHFVIGKFLGISSAVALLFIFLGTLFLLCVSYKVVYDGRETSNVYILWQDCYLEVARAVPGLVLYFMETVVLVGIAVAISTRLSMLANLTICMAIYVVGHLLPLLVQSRVGEFAIVQFMGQFFAAVFPVLEHFNVYGSTLR